MKRRKRTKAYNEFSRLIKNMVEMRRYYGKNGVYIPDVRDYYTRADASAANLKGLKKFKKQVVDPFVSRVKSAVKGIAKDKGLSIPVSYKRYSAEQEGPVSAAEVTIDTFYKQIDSFANAQTREAMRRFMNEFEASVEDREQLADILEETAEEDEAFEALKYYEKADIASNNLSNLIANMTDRLRETQPFTADILADKIGEFFS